jgi:hypothetical protein
VNGRRLVGNFPSLWYYDRIDIEAACPSSPFYQGKTGLGPYFHHTGCISSSVRSLPIISYFCFTREGDADSEVNSGPCDTLYRNLGPFFCDFFVALELDFVVDVSDVGDLVLKAPALPFDITLDSPAFAN